MNRIRHLFTVALLSGILRRTSAVSNDESTITPLSVSNAVGISGEFSFNAEGQLVCPIPYGEFGGRNDRRELVTQAFNRESAETMAGVFSNSDGIVAKVKRFIMQGIHRRSDVPLYKGHPDDPNRAETDDSAMGWLKTIVANTDSMDLVFDLTPHGRELIESKTFRFVSPRWSTQPVSNGRKNTVSPCHLISVGLTNNPNLPVAPLSNSDEPAADAAPASNSCPMCGEGEEERCTVRQKLFLEADATPEQVAAAIERRTTEVSAMMADIDALKKQLGEEQAKTTAAETALAASNSLIAERNATISNLTTERDNAVSNREQAHTALVNVELRALQAAGKLTPAQFTEEVTACGAMSNSEFTEHLARLAADPSRMKTTAVTSGAAEQRGELTISNSGDATRARQRADFISGIMNDPRYTRIPTDARRALAWQEMQKQRPELMP